MKKYYCDWLDFYYKIVKGLIELSFDYLCK